MELENCIINFRSGDLLLSRAQVNHGVQYSSTSIGDDFGSQAEAIGGKLSFDRGRAESPYTEHVLRARNCSCMLPSVTVPEFRGVGGPSRANPTLVVGVRPL